MPGIHKLSARKVQTLNKRGRHSDGGGLYLSVGKSGSKSWCYMWVRNGRRREMGLGGYPGVPLSLARERAQEARELVAIDKDPILERRQQIVVTFGEAADHLVETLSVDWTNNKHRQQWSRTVNHYCAPIRALPVNEVSTDDVLKVLEPIWTTKEETARRLRSRVERILDYASAREWRHGDNPARWQGHLKDILPKRDKTKIKNFASMPYEILPGFFTKVSSNHSIPSLALRFAILTAARTGEVLEATWSEIDFNETVWTIPGVRMKAKQEHVVPLSDHALVLLREAKLHRVSEYIFPGVRKGRPLSNMSMTMLLRRTEKEKYTVHGFRSTFRDWCGDKTDFPREVAEAALAHKVGNKVEQAYRRRSALEKRCRLMDEWSEYCLIDC